MLQKSSMLRTLELFFVSPNKAHYLMGMSREIKLAHTSLKKNVKVLLKNGLIMELKEKRGGRVFPVYKARSDDKNFRRQKISYNISALFESGVVDFIQEKLMPKSIVLFGSYARGEDTEQSDIDLFVECNEEELKLEKFEKKLGRTIEIHFKEHFNTYPNELKNNIINGVVVSGFLEGCK